MTDFDTRSTNRLAHCFSRCSGAYFLVAFLLLVSLAHAVEPATLVLRGGKVVTLDDANPTVQAIAIRDDRIIAVGSDDEIDKFVGDSTRVIKLKGRLAIPGFIEGHGHFMGLGQSLSGLDLSTYKSWSELVDAVGKAAKTTPRGRWITGRGWHQDKWTRPPDGNVSGYPVHDKLCHAVPNHPVLLTHASGHMSLANAAAMRLAGVNRATRDPSGGEILRNEAGDPIGVFRENAAGLIRRAYNRSQGSRTQKQIQEDLQKTIKLATDECLSNGITSFQDAGSSFATVDLFKQLAQRGELKVRLWVMLSESNLALARRMSSYRMIGVGNHHLTVRAVKRIFDGALGTHGAWLFEPYDDLPNSRGHNTVSIESLRRTCALGAKNDFQLCVHAIGDRANHEVLNVFEETFKASADRSDWRWRVEHAQHLHVDDIPRFNSLGVIASMQGIHCTSDAPFVVKRLGMRRAKQGAYVWQSLLKSGAVVINGTDAPVERVNPIDCFYASVTRKLPDGVEFFPEQRMTRDQALRSYTTSAAFAAHEEDLKGTLSPGKLADIVVLSKDILTVPEDEIREAKAVYTIVGGRVRFER